MFGYYHGSGIYYSRMCAHTIISPIYQHTGDVGLFMAPGETEVYAWFGVDWGTDG
jgi:hypothetical protein